ncbi:hypothetical protein Tco_1412912 [Tanacetum coccineum]
MMLEKKVNTTPVDYAVLNQLSQDFETRFVPQTKLFAEQAFWSSNSMNSPEPTLSSRPTKVEVPKELPKDNMVNTSLKKLKHHLAGFEAVEQHRLESKTFEAKMNQVLNENERLLEQVINKDIVNIIMNSSVDIASVNMHEYEKCLKLETELSTKRISAQSQEKDTVIKKLKERIKSLNGKMNEDKIKKDLEKIETINIELDHRVSKLIAENEHLKQAYTQLYDSIKPARIQSKEQSLKDVLRKLKGKALVDNAVTKHTIDPEMLKIDVEPITPKLLNKRTTHSADIKHTLEEAAVLRDLVDRVKANYPLDHSLESACRPTGRTFTIVGNACPLTRITTTTEVPLRKPTALNNETSKPVVILVYSRKPRKSKTNISVSKSKILKSVVQIVLWYLDFGCSKHMTGDRSQLTNFVNKFLGTVNFGNDHMAKILGYCDYQIGNVTISRVYYVEGLGHNLFSIGQFCDSNLEVAFCQHTCFIRNLEGVDLLPGS